MPPSGMAGLLTTMKVIKVLKRKFYTIMLKWILSTVMIGFLTACAHVISQESLKEADPDLTFQSLIEDLNRYQGKKILVGGRILSTENREGGSWLEVLQHPLDWQQRPKDTDESYGRFLVRFGGFLDPAIYQEGREISAAGVVVGQETLPLGHIQYSYPVIQAREIHLWKKRKPVRYYHPWYWDYPYWWDPYGYPYWRRSYYR